MKLRRHHWGVLALTLLILGGLVGYSLVKNGIFPVAYVDGKFITHKTVEENALVVQRLWNSDLLTKEVDPADFSLKQDKLFEEALESLIVNVIIEEAAPREIKQEADAKLESSLATANVRALGETIKVAYGWNLNRFEERILRPQALEEALQERMGVNYESWLRQAKARASVKIWFMPFAWQEGQLCRTDTETVC